MRHNPSTVVVLAGQPPEGLLSAVSGTMNVSLVRPEDAADGIEAAAGALRRAAGISSLLHALGSLRHGRWWPPLEEVIETARRFYPGALAGSAVAAGWQVALGPAIRRREATAEGGATDRSV